MAVIYPSQSRVQAKLRFRLRRQTWTEKYFLGSGAVQGYLATLNTLCQLRASWLGQNVSIDYAAASDLGTTRDSIIADYLPVFNPYSGINGVSNDVNVGYEYRFQRADGHKFYRVFRGIPDTYITNDLAVGGPWVPNSIQFGNAFDIPTSGPWYNPLDNGVPGGTAIGPGVTVFQIASGLLNFLVTKTHSITFSTLTTPAWTDNGVWSYVLFRAVRTRRTGQSWEGKKGRFQR